MNSPDRRPQPSYRPVRFTLGIARLVSLSVSILAVCSLSLKTSAAPSGTNATPPCCRQSLDPSPPTDRSVYLLESTWTSDVGKRVPLRVLRGRPQVVALFFTHCEYACPVTVAEMKRLEASLPPEIRDRVDFLLVSMDPDRDAPAVLATYRRDHALAPSHWTLLTGDAEDVRELAALLGINFKPDGRGQFAHSNLITVLNAEGEIAHQYAGLKVPVDEASKLLERLTAPAQKPRENSSAPNSGSAPLSQSARLLNPTGSR